MRSLELDYWPFSFIYTTEKHSEVAEVEWSETSQESRTELENHAKLMKEMLIPYADSWSAVEDVFGLSLQNDFPGIQEACRIAQTLWLETIEMHRLSPRGTREACWKVMDLSDKKDLIARVKIFKVVFCAERIAKEAAVADKIAKRNISFTSKPANDYSGRRRLHTTWRGLGLFQ